MMVKKYRKRPVEVEAVFLTEENFTEVYDWIEQEGENCEPFLTGQHKDPEGLIIATPEGKMTAYPSRHYVVRGVKGEFYPVDKEIFEETYEEVKD